MEKETIRQFIQQARGFSEDPNFQELINSFEKFASLLEQGESAMQDPNFVNDLTSAHAHFWEAFGHVATQFGITPEMLQTTLKEMQTLSPEEYEQTALTQLMPKKSKEKLREEQELKAPHKMSQNHRQKVRV